MASSVNEDEYKSKAAELFEKLKERAEHLREPGAIVSDIYTLIDDSESLLNSGQIAESKKKYEEARGKIETMEISHKAEPLAWKLFGVEIGYLVFLLLLAYLMFKWPTFSLWDGLQYDPLAMHLKTVWFGMLGGITIAIYGIYEHIRLRDFDPEYKLWYICKPLTGGIFGWFVYMIYFIGLVSVQGSQVKITTPELPYIIAFLAGFSERFTLKMIDKLMNVLLSWEEKSPGSATKKEATGQNIQPK